MSEELPSGWATASIDVLTDYVQRGKSPKYAIKSDLPVINQKCVRWWGVDPEHLKYVAEEQWPSWSEERFVQDGDILWNSTGTGTIGRAALFRKLPDIDRIVCDSHVTIVRANEACDPRYLYWFIRSPRVQDRIEEMQAGSTNQVELARGEVLATQVPLAPSPEQRRIVAKIDSLFARSSRARDELAHIPKLIDRYRQAVLEAAFRGDLTADWRAEHDVSLDSWKTAKVPEVCKIVSGQTPKGIEEAVTADGEVMWFKVSSMNDTRNTPTMTQSEFRLSSSDARRLGLRLIPEGAVIFPKRGGAIATNKKRRIGEPAAIDLNLMALIPTRISADYLWAWMCGLDLATLSNGSNVPQINNGDIEPLEIPIPSLEEQVALVEAVQARLEAVMNIQSEVEKGFARSQQLDQSILDKAFSGQLVPQDPADEPASKLLERIQAARAAAPKAKRGRMAKGAA